MPTSDDRSCLVDTSVAVAYPGRLWRSASAAVRVLHADFPRTYHLS